MGRQAQITRNTGETQISIKIDLDGTGKNKIETGIGFFNHMLQLFSFHSKIDLALEAKGDLVVCDHHIVEDTGIVLGLALKRALGDKVGIKRYGTFFLPMDETLAMCSLDISGRAYLCFNSEFKREKVGEFSTEMVKEFFRAVAFNAGLTLHLKVLYGENDHHKIEALFKAFARSIKEALIIEGCEISSTKGVL